MKPQVAIYPSHVRIAYGDARAALYSESEFRDACADLAQVAGITLSADIRERCIYHLRQIAISYTFHGARILSTIQPRPKLEPIEDPA